MLYSSKGPEPIAGQVSAPIVVVGTGPGGATTARELAASGRNVLMIEAGPFLQPSDYAPFSMEEMVAKYRNQGLTMALGSPKIQYAEACCVGGGSEINSGLYHRVPEEILNRWQMDYEIEGLAADDLQPHFRQIESDLEISTSELPPAPASQKLADGARKLGWDAAEVPRWTVYNRETAAREPVMGDRRTMVRTYLDDFLRMGGRILAETTVISLKRAGSKWRLRCVYRGNRGRPAQLSICAETVFMACGAIHSPALLRRSGIRRNIGNRLQVHPTIKIAALFPEEVNSSEMGVPIHQVKQFAPRISMGGSISTLPHLAIALTDHPKHGLDLEKNWTRMAIYYAMITADGWGKVRVLSGFRDPLVTYRLSTGDMNRLNEGLHKLARLLFAAGAERLFPSIRGGPCIEQESVDLHLKQPLSRKRTNLMTVHLFSSCPLGENRKLCAVDSFGKLPGQENLYVADASLLPTAPSVNPQGTIMAVARRNVHHYLQKHKI